MRHMANNKSKATSFFFLVKMITKLESKLFYIKASGLGLRRLTGHRSTPLFYGYGELNITSINLGRII